MKGVFDSKPTSTYDDDVTRHYQFPSRYMSVVEACLGDWIIFRRPRRDGGDVAYFATARIVEVETDRLSRGLHFAHLSEYWQFELSVPWTVDGRYWEEHLRIGGSQGVGAYLQGKSTRTISEADFADIIKAGFSDTLLPINLECSEPSLEDIRAAKADLAAPRLEHTPRRTERFLTNRPIREASFRRLVREAYSDRCAVTGLRILDSNDNTEAQAAHIWAVCDGGPDVVQNGVALSATAHWLFDRHLITITNDYQLLVAESGVPSPLRALLTPAGRTIHLPANSSKWPHPSYLEKHQARFFSKNPQCRGATGTKAEAT